MKSNASRNQLIDDHSEQSLHSKTLKGGVWMFCLKIVRVLFKALRIVVLARFLTENDFGLMGFALMTASIIETLTETGFHSALIQRKEIDNQFLDSAWTVSVLRGLILFAAMFVMAPLVAQFFDTPQAARIIQVYGVIVLVRGLSNIAVVKFRKNLEFGKHFIYQSSGVFVEVVVSIAIACVYRTVWAMVFGALAGEIVMCFASFLLHSYRPRFRFHREKGMQLFCFGKWILASNALSYFLMQGDDILVGKLIGVGALGLYQMAYTISNMTSTEISGIITQITFSAYSKIQHDLTGLGCAYLKVLHLAGLVVFPVAGVIFILSGEFVELFLGQKWIAIVPAMKVLALYGLLGSISRVTDIVFVAIGQPHIGTKIKAARVVLLAVLIYPLVSRWGILGASLAVTIETGIFFFVSLWVVHRLLKLNIKKLAKLLLLPCAASLIMIATVYTLKAGVFEAIGFIDFFVMAITAVLSYILAVAMLDKTFGWGAWDIVRKQLSIFSSGKDELL